jgi:glycosyltransferase involved in cell wall biosynthesis
LLSADIDPGPFALRPPVPWLESNDPLGPLLRAFALTPEIDVPWLTELIARVAPDAFTTFDFVPFGVLMLAVRRHSRAVTAPWMLALAETDLERVGHDPALATALAAVLADVDGLLVEREQEFTFAKSHGFRGTRVHAGPTCGGWRLSDCRALRRQGPASGRRVVAVSGARGVSGRPFVALRALHLTASALRDYKIVVYSPGEGVEIAARLLAARSGLEVELVAAGPDGDLLRPHGGARCSLALHASERTDPSLLDAAVMGSLPIGSVTCRADGRIRDGVTGLLVNPEDPPAVAAAVRRALADDALVDRAAAENEAMAEQRLSREVVGEPMLELYRVMARRQNVRPSR